MQETEIGAKLCLLWIWRIMENKSEFSNKVNTVVRYDGMLTL
jgi:hypothetical protein